MDAIAASGFWGRHILYAPALLQIQHTAGNALLRQVNARLIFPEMLGFATE
jgi:hypothetical protein